MLTGPGDLKVNYTCTTITGIIVIDKISSDDWTSFGGSQDIWDLFVFSKA